MIWFIMLWWDVTTTFSSLLFFQHGVEAHGWENNKFSLLVSLSYCGRTTLLICLSKSNKYSSSCPSSIEVQSVHMRTLVSSINLYYIWTTSSSIYIVHIIIIIIIINYLFKIILKLNGVFALLLWVPAGEVSNMAYVTVRKFSLEVLRKYFIYIYIYL